MVANHLRHRWNHLVQVEETGRRGGTVGCMHAAGGSIGDNQRRVIPQERDAHARTNEARLFRCGSRAIQGRAPLGTIARQILHALSEQ